MALEHKVNIHWGEHPELGSLPTTYEFATKGELVAFMKGVEAAEGWMGYSTTNDPNNKYNTYEDDEDEG